MKKALVVLLILAIAGGLFAQDEGLTWSGAVKTGLKITADDDHNGEDIKVDLYNDDAGEAIRLQLDGAYTKDNYGVKFGARAQLGSALDLRAYQAYGWVTFIDIIKVSAGIIDDGAWATAGPADYSVNGNGLRLEITPITGLNVGLMLRVPTEAFAPTTTPAWYTIKQFLSETAFGAKYGNDLFYVAGSLVLDSTIDEIQTLSGEDKWSLYGKALGGQSLDNFFFNAPVADNRDHGLKFDLGVGVTAVEHLTIKAELGANNVSKYTDFGWLRLDQDVSYKLLDDKLTVGLKAHEYFWPKNDTTKGLNTYLTEGDETDKGVKPYVKLTPYVSYAVTDPVTVGLEAGIGLWKDVLKTEFNLKPKVTYKVTDGLELVAFYNFSVLDFKKLADGGTDADALKGNTIQIDLAWTF
jgi:hypothetical protein